jgi:hypothetical protein
MTQGQKNFGKAWRERMSALRNLPQDRWLVRNGIEGPHFDV